MHIVIALDDCIRNVSAIYLELSDITEQEWLDHKSLITPHLKAEDKINLWYDQGYKIHIIAENDQYDPKWLKDHYIPYDSIIEGNLSIKPDYWIDSSVFRCFDVCPNVSNIFLLNENLSTDTIKQECQSFRLPYPVPPKIKFTEWNKVFIND